MSDPPRDKAPHEARHNKRRSKLDGLSPQQRERVAQWLEHFIPNVQRQISLGMAYLSEHPNDKHQIMQLRYWTAYVSVVKHLAYLARTERVRDAGNNPEG